MEKRLRHDRLRPKKSVMRYADQLNHVSSIIWLLVLFATTSVILVSPFVLGGKLYMGSDMQFHLSRIYELKSAISNGSGFSFISTHTFNSVGVPLNLLYSPLLLYPFAILTLLISNQVTAIYVGIMLMFFVSLVVNYNVAIKFWHGDKYKALLFSYVYTFSSVNFGILFSGFTLGQASAIIFYPLAIYGMYAIFWGYYGDWYFLAIGMSLLLYTHLISVVLIALVVLVLFVIALLTSKGFLLRIRYFVLSIILAICLSSFFLVGFISTQTDSKLSITKIFQLENGTVGAGDFLWNSISNSYSPLSIGFIFLFTVVVGFIKHKKLSTRMNYVLWMAISCVILTTSLFPWNLFQNTFFNVIQFPYRILSVGAVFMGVLFAELFSIKVLKKLTLFHKKVSVIGMLIFICVLFLGNFQMFVTEKNSQAELNYTPYSWHIAPASFYVAASSYNNLFGYNAGVGSTDYWPQKSMKHIYDIKTHVVNIDGRANYAQNQTTLNNGFEYVINSKQDNSKIDLPILNYHSYKVELNGEKIPYSESKRGTIQVKGTKGTNDIKVQYKVSNSLTVAIYLSIFSWTILILTWLWRTFTKRDGVSNENF